MSRRATRNVGAVVIAVAVASAAALILSSSSPSRSAQATAERAYSCLLLQPGQAALPSSSKAWLVNAPKPFDGSATHSEFSASPVTDDLAEVWIDVFASSTDTTSYLTSMRKLFAGARRVHASNRFLDLTETGKATTYILLDGPHMSVRRAMEKEQALAEHCLASAER